MAATVNVVPLSLTTGTTRKHYMTTTIEVPAPIVAFLDDLDAFVAALAASRRSSAAAADDGIVATYPKNRAVDAILDLRNAAVRSQLGDAVRVCDETLDAIRTRPNLVDVSDLDAFCALVRSTATA